MQVALPRTTTQVLALPLVTLILGAAGGAAVTVSLDDDDVVRVPAQSQPASVETPAPSPGPSIDPSEHPNRLGARPGGPAVQPDSESSFGSSNSLGARP
jgi:hypothetical protein